MGVKINSERNAVNRKECGRLMRKYRRRGNAIYSNKTSFLC
jgi:hypothetical protein